jgi:serine protease Do
MKRFVAGGAVLVALVLAAAGIWQTTVRAQRADILTLVGPGSTIGVTVREVTQDDANTAKLAQPAGVYVESVRPETAAARAGFQAGDIILDFNGERIVSVRQFTRVVQESPPRREVDAVVVRGTARQTLKVVPETGRAVTRAPQLRRLDPEPRALPRDFTLNLNPNVLRFRDRLVSGAPVLGADVMPLGSQLAEYFGVNGGTLVTEVQSGTPAEAAGLKAGDVITAINGRQVTGAADLRDELRRAAPAGGHTLTVTRDRKALVLKASPPERAAPSGRGGLPI